LPHAAQRLPDLQHDTASIPGQALSMSSALTLAG